MTFYVHILRPGLMGQWREKKYGERVEYGVRGKNINAKGGFVGIGWESVCSFAYLYLCQSMGKGMICMRKQDYTPNQRCLNDEESMRCSHNILLLLECC
jgi:hypothetical protein